MHFIVSLHEQSLWMCVSEGLTRPKGVMCMQLSEGFHKGKLPCGTAILSSRAGNVQHVS